MPRHPKRDKKQWVKAGFEVAVVVNRDVVKAKDDRERDHHSYGDFHKMDADDWDFKKISHIIPIATFEDAMESYREHDGAGPCSKCYPNAKKGQGVDDDD